jgi:hypothetical protein
MNSIKEIDVSKINKFGDLVVLRDNLTYIIGSFLALLKG